MASMALGLTRPEGREPALWASTRPAPWMRAKASAIWLRLLFSTQTNRTRRGGTEGVLTAGGSSCSGRDAQGPAGGEVALLQAEGDAQVQRQPQGHCRQG